MNSFQVENIIKAIKKKVKHKKTIYVELTSLSNFEIQCQYSIFYNLEFYFQKENIEKECKQKFFFEKFIPLSKINNELFYRILYYYFFPEKDQLWTNNYIMPDAICNNPQASHLMKVFFSKKTELDIYNKSSFLLDFYSDNETKILFFVTPIYQKENFALKMENNFLIKKLNNLVKLNNSLDKKFFKNCNMFADTLHLSPNGINIINKKKIFTDF